MDAKPIILIVDDHLPNRELLKDVINTMGYDSQLAEDGNKALAMMEQTAPDLVLLDILMPGIDGYETLDRMKTDKRLRKIPVIMITAMDDINSVVRCIEIGADDYLTKPFNPTLLKARIHGSLEKKLFHDREDNYRKQIEEYNLHLESRVKEKTKELFDAHQKLKILDKAKKDFLELIAHELRTPLSGMLGAASILFEDNWDEDTYKKVKEMFHRSSDRMLAIIEGASLISQIDVAGESFLAGHTSINNVLKSASKITGKFAESRKVKIGDVPDCAGTISGSWQLLTKAMTALINTAIRFSTEDNTVTFSCEAEDEFVLIKITAKGRSIPDDYIPNFFEIFSISEPITPGGDLGLEPPISEKIIKLFGGTIMVENLDPPGIIFNIRLKLTEA